MAARDIELRPLRGSDLPAVQAIQRASPEAAQWNDSQYAASFSDGDSYAGLIAEQDGRVLGFLLYRSNGPGETEVVNLAVYPDARRRGVAMALVTALRRGTPGDIFLEVRSANEAARALYERSEFVVVGRRTNYYRDPVDDALIMKVSGSPREGLPPEMEN